MLDKPDQTTLTDPDLRMFARLGIGPELLEAAQVCRVTHKEAREYGFRYSATSKLDGLVFPYLDPSSGLRRSSRLRRDDPEVDPTGKPRAKYLSPYGDNRHLYFPPGAGALLADRAAPVVFVEAEKSSLAVTALAARTRRHLLCVGTGGCWGWHGKTGIQIEPNGEREEVRSALSDLDLICWENERIAIICFDSNAVTNAKVRRAREAMADHLAAKGAQVLFGGLPAQAGVNGPDDLIAICGDEAFLNVLQAAYPSPAEAFNRAERAVGSLRKTSKLAEREAAFLLISQVDDYGRREYLIGRAGKALGEPRTVIRRVVEGHRMNSRTKSAYPAEGDLPKTDGPYFVEGSRICMRKNTLQGPLLVPLCNFNARVREELVMDDGLETTRAFVLEGQLESGRKLPTVRVPVARFSGMSWVTELWGLPAVVGAGLAIRDQLREAIERLSPEAPQRRVFTHTGWRQIDGRWLYLTTNGAVGCDGFEVQLGPGLERYSLPKKADHPASAVKLSLKLLHLAPLTVTVPLWAAVFRAPLATPLPSDLSLWPEGRTGSLKSTVSALILCHFGNFERTCLPGTWLSTANQLEHRAFALKDTVFVIDDYAPGTLDARELEIKASRLLRAQGNVQGRGRLRADLSERVEHPPRGLIISTGEQHPPGQSILARNLVIRMKREDIDLIALSEAQRSAGRLKHAMTGYLTWLAPQMPTLPALLRETFEGTRERVTASEEHLRVPEALAHLWLGLDCGLVYAEEIGACSHAEAEDRRAQYWDALLTVGRAQGRLIEGERPSRRFLSVLRTLLTQRRAILLPKNDPGEIAHKEVHLLGWFDAEYLYLIPDAVFQTVARFCREASEGFPVPQRRLMKDLHEEGLSVCDSEHFTTTAKIAGHTQRVLELRRSAVESFLGEEFPVPVTTVTEVTGSSE